MWIRVYNKPNNKWSKKNRLSHVVLFAFEEIIIVLNYKSVRWVTKKKKKKRKEHLSWMQNSENFFVSKNVKWNRRRRGKMRIWKRKKNHDNWRAKFSQCFQVSVSFLFSFVIYCFSLLYLFILTRLYPWLENDWESNNKTC